MVIEENCPDHYYHGFNNGFHCCRTFKSELSPPDGEDILMTLELDNDSGHCSSNNTIVCPGLPGNICKEQRTRAFVCCVFLCYIFPCILNVRN